MAPVNALPATAVLTVQVTTEPCCALLAKPENCRRGCSEQAAGNSALIYLPNQSTIAALDFESLSHLVIVVIEDYSLRLPLLCSSRSAGLPPPTALMPTVLVPPSPLNSMAGVVS